MKTPAYYKRQASEALEGNWGNAVLIILVYIVIYVLYTIFEVIYVPPTELDLLISSPLEGTFFDANADSNIFLRFIVGLTLWIASLGVCIWMWLAFLDLYRKDENWCKLEYKDSAIKLVFAHIVMIIFILLWTFLFIIPGLIKVFAYSQTLFILKDNPKMSIMGALDESQRMMRGHKWELLWLYLTFFGWFILSILSAGILFFYFLPYANTTIAAYYDDLKKETTSEVAKVAEITEVD